MESDGFFTQLGNSATTFGTEFADQTSNFFSQAFDFTLPDSDMDFVSAFYTDGLNADGLFSSDTAASILAEQSLDFSENVGEKVADYIADDQLFSQAAQGSPGGGGGLLSWLDGDEGKAILGGAARLWWANRQAERQRKHEEDLLDRKKRHLGAGFVSGGGNHPGA